MLKLISLVALASVAITTVSAVDITFRRYSQADCDGVTQHIAADTHLHDPDCKSFDTDEPAFYSFIVVPEDDMEDVWEKYCWATVYDGVECTGQAFTFGNMQGYLNSCANSAIPGRSVRISCASASTTVTAAPSTATTVTAIVPVTGSATTITEETFVVETSRTRTRVRPTTTVTLVPGSDFDNDDDDDDWWKA